MKTPDIYPNAKIVFMQDGDNMVSTIDCTPAELLGAIQTLTQAFADAAGIDYNTVLTDLHTTKGN